MFDFFGNKANDATEQREQDQVELTPFQQEMLPIRNALEEGKTVSAQNALEKINPCQLDGVEGELNKDRTHFYWYSTSVEDLPDSQQKRFSVHKIGKTSGSTPVMSTIFTPCQK